MIDVRNAVAGILDRYTLADVVEVTLRKMKRDKLPLPFSKEYEEAREALKLAGKSPVDGHKESFLSLLKDVDDRKAKPSSKPKPRRSGSRREAMPCVSRALSTMPTKQGATPRIACSR